jgi:hypothetical protein
MDLTQEMKDKILSSLERTAGHEVTQEEKDRLLEWANDIAMRWTLVEMLMAEQLDVRVPEGSRPKFYPRDHFPHQRTN